jgi:hypothetical protein
LNGCKRPARAPERKAGGGSIDRTVALNIITAGRWQNSLKGYLQWVSFQSSGSFGISCACAKKWWMGPIVLVMLSLLIVLTQGSALAPFIYTLF